jgi:hypothetical protein
MAETSSENPSEVGRLLLRAAAGDPEGWRALLDRDRERLPRMVALRMDRRLQDGKDRYFISKRWTGIVKSAST